jgi:transcription initiation factor IIE alpha subunit
MAGSKEGQHGQPNLVYRPANPPPPKHDPVLLGCNITSSGDDQYNHRFTALNRGFNEENGEILIGPAKGMEGKQYGQYSDELFKTPIDRTENKLSTGVMMNPYTGEMFETFENAMPPPNTDKSIPVDRFRQTNPKLMWAQGGIDKNAPLRHKKEICKKIPGVDHGPNIWGDQLYEDRRRERIKEIVNRDLWMNRNGDVPEPAGFAKEKPAGFTGLVPYYRSLPYLPPTQTLDNKGYVPVTAYQAPERAPVKSTVFVRKPDLTTCSFQFAAGAPNGIEADYVVQDTELRHTWRGYQDTDYTGPANADGTGAYVVTDTTVRPTLKEQMESEFPVPVTNTTVAQSGGAGYVVVDTTVRPTLKEQMESPFEALNANAAGTGGYVVQDTCVRPTLKEQMENPFEAMNANAAGTGAYVVQDTTVRPTLKEQMESPFEAMNANASGTGAYVVTDTTVRSTLKEQMESQFDPLNANAAGTGAYVVTDTTVRPTLKEQMEDSFEPMNANASGTGAYVVTDTTVRSTLKEQMEDEFPTQYAELDGTGSWIPFQGPLQETRRQFYEKLPNVGRQAHSAFFGGGAEAGAYVGTGAVTSKQHRGTFATNHVNLSKVQADAEDTSVRWIGQYTRDSKREPMPYTPQAELASSYQSVAPRMFGTVAPPCNLDIIEVDDEFNTMSHGFLYPTQTSVQG